MISSTNFKHNRFNLVNLKLCCIRHFVLTFEWNWHCYRCKKLFLISIQKCNRMKIDTVCTNKHDVTWFNLTLVFLMQFGFEKWIFTVYLLRIKVIFHRNWNSTWSVFNLKVYRKLNLIKGCQGFLWIPLNCFY